MSEVIRVGVADDHPMFRAGVVASLEAIDSIEVVDVADSAATAVALVRSKAPDVMVLDVGMPGGGLAAAREIVESCPGTRVVMLTVSEDEDDLMGAIKTGAVGYVLKGAGGREFADVIHTVMAGQVYVSPSLAFGALRELQAPRSSPYAELTEREREVLACVGRGLSNGEVAHEMGISEKTVKHHMTRIMGKLGVRSRVEAALFVAREGSPLSEGPTPGR